MFLFFMVIFLELINIHDFSLGTFLEQTSDRMKFKLLLQLKKTLTKEMVEVKIEKHCLNILVILSKMAKPTRCI